MKGATSPVFAFVLLAACTAYTPSSDPIVKRRFVGGGLVERDSSRAVWTALEAHGIDCSSFEGKTSGDRDRWNTSCSGSEQEWRQAEPAIARLTAEGILQELIDRDFAITDPAQVDERSREFVDALQHHGVSCRLEGNSVSHQLLCVGNPQEWSRAESTIARLTADGVVTET
jgi:hypothetical protein